jgi:adenosylmethionine-8-amino-7-oxononanoate aminotransferase
MNRFAELDRRHVWHPFTQMRDWCRDVPIVISKGKGAVLHDSEGRRYLDANSSIWTNLHGHAHPRINAAIRAQLGRISHSSALGFANEPASLLAEKLVRTARLVGAPKGLKNPRLAKVFFSDDGSTALEVAIKLSYESTRRGRPAIKPRFLSVDGAYHGDTVGSVSVGQIDLFHKAYSGLLFKSGKVMSPYCYRCPHNRAKPERRDARDYRLCHFECVDEVEGAFEKAKQARRPFTAFAFEPLMQGAAGMIPQPHGWLRRTAEIARSHGAQLIADEVMTGFARCNVASMIQGRASSRLFASHEEGVQPDFLCLAKGLTGGYLPMAATLTTGAVFEAFLGEYSEFKTFFHGHSFTGNQLGSVASLANLELLTEQKSQDQRARLQSELQRCLKTLWAFPAVGDIRQVGNVVGIELVRDWKTKESIPLAEQAGIRVCRAMAARGVLTRPVGNVIVLMPPYCTTAKQVGTIVNATAEAIEEVLCRPN